MASVVISDIKGKTSVETIPRFRVVFENITIRPFSASNPAPIGLRVIGVNNFIG